jgi:hypothetical protein
MITFPFGYGEYHDVPANVATRFDGVLDSLCCRRSKKGNNILGSPLEMARESRSDDRDSRL